MPTESDVAPVSLKVELIQLVCERFESRSQWNGMESDNGLNSKDHKQVKQKCEIPFFYGIELNLHRYVIEVGKFFVEFVTGTDKY